MQSHEHAPRVRILADEASLQEALDRAMRSESQAAAQLAGRIARYRTMGLETAPAAHADNSVRPFASTSPAASSTLPDRG